MAKFYLEMTYPGCDQAKYLVLDGENKVWVDWEHTDGANFVCVNSQLRNDILEATFEKEVTEFMEMKGRTLVRINMVRYDECARSLSGQYTIYRRWDIKPLMANTKIRWVPLCN